MINETTFKINVLEDWEKEVDAKVCEFRREYFKYPNFYLTNIATAEKIDKVRQANELSGKYDNLEPWEHRHDNIEMFLGKNHEYELSYCFRNGLADDCITILFANDMSELVEHLGDEIDETAKDLGYDISAIVEDVNIRAFPRIKGLKWEDIKITFTSDQDVRVEAKHINKRFHYIDMGFSDKRRPDRPSNRWELLEELARHHGEARFKDKIDIKIGIRDGKKAFSDIRKKLKKFFSIEEDPFYPYIKTRSYKTKFILNSILQD